MKKFSKFIPCITTLAIMMVIFIFSAENAEESTQSSTGFIQILTDMFSRIFNAKQDLPITKSIEYFVRKAAHFSIYTLLGINACWMFSNIVTDIKKRSALLSSVIFCFVYACTDELHQMLSPGRSASFFDVLLDTTGALFGSLVFLLTVAIYKYFKQKKVKK